MRRTLAAVLLVAWHGVMLAYADGPSAGAEAEILFNRGIDLLDHGKIAEACDAFDASQKLEPTLSTLLNQADCREQNHQLATAWGLFLDAERQSRTTADQQTQQFHAVAAARAAKLEARVSKLTINVAPERRLPGMEVRRGDVLLAAGAWNQPLPVDGGDLTISVTAPDHAPWTGKVTVAIEGDARTIDVPLLEPSPVAPAPAPTQTSAPSTPSDQTGPSSRQFPIVPLALGGGALALGGVALAFELSAEGTYGDSTKEPNDSKQASLYHSANNKRYIAEGLGVAGLACAGVAVWLYLRQGSETKPPSVGVVPTVDDRHAGLQLFTHF